MSFLVESYIKIQKKKKNEIFESALYMKSRSMPLNSYYYFQQFISLNLAIISIFLMLIFHETTLLWNPIYPTWLSVHNHIANVMFK